MSIPSAGGLGSMGPVRRGDDPGAPFPRNAVVLAARVLLHPVHFPPARRAPDVRLRIRIAIKELHHV